MGSVIDQKKKIFGNIAAMRTLTDGLPTLKSSSSFPSINNKGNSLDFLSDLLKSLVGYEELRKIVVDILVNDLIVIEHEIKKTLKSELKELVNCGVNPSIPEFIKFGNNGVNVKVKQIDFFDILLNDPNSLSGSLLYDDVTTGLSSTDFNTFLYNTIQSISDENWGASVTNNDILNIKFRDKGIDPIPNNTLTITASDFYSSQNNKTLTDLNNDYIDSIKLFGSEKIINNIIDSLFGSISVTLNKSRKQLENEEKINSIIDRMVNSKTTDVIDNSFFTFNNDDISSHQIIANDRKKGVRKLKTGTDLEVGIPQDFLNKMQTDLNNTTNKSQVSDVISSSINNMASFTSTYSKINDDKYAIQLNFIQEILNKLVQSIVNVLLSPKIITIFIINYKILYGPSATYDDAVDFLRKNKTLVKNISRSVSDSIIQTLLKTALKHITLLVGETLVQIETEKAKMRIAKLLSLVGVPQDTIRLIQGLG